MDYGRETAGQEINPEETFTQAATGDKATGGREDSIRREYDFAPDVKLKECRYCRVMIPKNAKICPNCRMSLRRHWFRNLTAAVFAVVVIGVGGYYLSGHWGIMKDTAVSVWMAQNKSALPVMSVTTVDNTELASGAAAAEPSGTASLSESVPEQVTESAAEQAAESIPEQATESAVEQADEGKQLGAEDTTGKAADGRDAEIGSEATDGAANADHVQTTMAKRDGDPTEEETEEAESMEDTEATEDSGNPGTDTPAKNMDRQEQAYREECVLIGYKSLLRNTEKYLDTALMMEVQVECQVDGGLFDDNTYYLCKAEDENNITRYYIVRDDRATDDTLILEGDMLTVFGQLFGTCKIPADLIRTRPTVPAVSMVYYDLTGE